MKKTFLSSLFVVLALSANSQTFEFDAVQINNLIMLGEDIRASSYMDEKTHKEIFGDEHSVYGDTIPSAVYVEFNCDDFISIFARDKSGRIYVKFENIFKCTIFSEDMEKYNTISLMLENRQGDTYAQIDIAPYYVTIDEGLNGKEPTTECRQHFFFFEESHNKTGKIFLAPDVRNPTYKRNKEVFLKFAKNLMTYNGHTIINELNVQYLIDHADEFLGR